MIMAWHVNACNLGFACIRFKSKAFQFSQNAKLKMDSPTCVGNFYDIKSIH